MRSEFYDGSKWDYYKCKKHTIFLHVASYVGGVADMMVGNEENLYRFEEINMLAEKVCRVFAKKESPIDLSKVALQRHSQRDYAQQLLEIYYNIYNQ